MALGLSILINNQSQPVLVAARAGIVNTAGGGAGASVSTAVSFVDQYSNGLLPAGGYVVQVTPNTSGVSTAVSGKTNSGFNVVLAPTLSTATLAAGTFDCLVVG
jgi:hypothetical protein